MVRNGLLFHLEFTWSNPVDILEADLSLVLTKIYKLLPDIHLSLGIRDGIRLLIFTPSSWIRNFLPFALKSPRSQLVCSITRTLRVCRSSQAVRTDTFSFSFCMHAEEDPKEAFPFPTAVEELSEKEQAPGQLGRANSLCSIPTPCIFTLESSSESSKGASLLRSNVCSRQWHIQPCSNNPCHT